MLGGVGIDVIAAENAARHASAYPEDGRDRRSRALATGGEYQWRRDGPPHLFNPDTVFRLQHATRTRRYDIFREYTKLVDDQAENLMTLRGLFKIKDGERPAVPIDEVESGRVDRQALLHRRDELRLDQSRGARDARDRDEPPRRASPTRARAARTSTGCSTPSDAAPSSRWHPAASASRACT